MSLERLALAVLLPGRPGTVLDGPWATLLEEGLGGLCLFAANMPCSTLVGSIREVAPGAVVAVDEEGGDVTRLHAATGSPVLGHAALGVVDDVGVTRGAAAAIAASLVDVGVNLNLAPVADVNSNLANPVIGVRSFGADPALVARHVAAYVEGLQGGGVSACAKHFPGHGDTHEDSHLALPRVEISAEQLRARELVPFAAAVEAGVDAVMTSHIVIPALDERPATLSSVVLGLLRSELGFDGLVVSDALDMAGASAQVGIPASAVLALAAGCDLLCLGASNDVELVRAVQTAIVTAVRDGSLEESRLIDASERVDALPGRTPVTAGAASNAEAPILVEGEVPDLSDAVVARFSSEPSIAVGPVPWGLPGVEAASLRPDGPVVVLQVRDLHLHAEAQALVEKLLPDVVLVEYGWPAPLSVHVPRICSFGASLPSRDAVSAYLRSKGCRT